MSATSLRHVFAALVATVCLALAPACGSTVSAAGGAPNRYQLFASGFLGCRARDVVTTEFENDSTGSVSWIATCGARRFVCGGWPGSSVQCAELVGP